MFLLTKYGVIPILFTIFQFCKKCEYSVDKGLRISLVITLDTLVTQ
jgi:hypothetical protein